MKTLTSYVIALSVLGLSQTAKAGVEVKVFYNYHMISPSDMNTLNANSFGSTYPKYDKMTGFGADGLYHSSDGLGFGLRYEVLSSSVSGVVYTQENKADRLAILAAFRIINKGFFLGPVGTYGVSHNQKITHSGPDQLPEIKPDTYSSYSVGVEAGIKHKILLFGVELGYLNFVGKDVKQNGAPLLCNGQVVNSDLSGMYLKAGAGFAL